MKTNQLIQAPQPPMAHKHYKKRIVSFLLTLHYATHHTPCPRVQRPNNETCVDLSEVQWIEVLSPASFFLRLPASPLLSLDDEEDEALSDHLEEHV